jgi:GT2 family glycosyltransferase
MSVDISILITTRNRLTSLKRQFMAFEELDTAGLTFEILVVDNGSTDGTYEWLKGMASRLPVKSLLEPRPGKNLALNRALPKAQGSLILFTDDDTLPVRSWLREYHSAIGRWPRHNIFSGPIEPVLPLRSPPALCDPGFRFATALFCSFKPADSEGVISVLPFGGNFAVRAHTLLSCWFCETIGPSADSKYTMGSETELLQRLKARGEETVYLPGTKVLHIIRDEQLTLKWLKGRGFRQGRSHVRLWDCDTSSTRLFGVPRYLWRKLVNTGMRTSLHQVLRMPQRWESAFIHNMVRGQIYEYLSTKADGCRTEAQLEIGAATGSSGRECELSV